MSGVRVVVDGSALHPEQGGLWTYSTRLLPLLGGQDGIELRVITTCSDEFAALGIEPIALPAEVGGSVYRRSLWRQRTLPSLAADNGDVLLGIAHEVPIGKQRLPSVLVLHDVGALVAPSRYGRAKWLRFKLAVPRMLKSAALTVCVSDATRADVERTVGTGGARVEVIGEGPTIEPLEPDLDTRSPYVLYVGSNLAHKNTATIIEAVSDMPEHAPRLVMAGPPIGETTAADLGSRVEHRGFVDDDELRSLYAGATAILVPSLHEGFGLPALDAMFAGVPVIASDIPALREVVGDAGLLIEDPLNAAQWRNAITSLDDTGLRARLIAQGLAQASKFSWELAAQRFAELLKELGER
jgi:glycosyltransferase involved in cell wall biosynthesis